MIRIRIPNDVKFSVLLVMCSLAHVLGGSYTDPTTKGDFFVAPNGSDQNQGTEQQPFATITRAKGAVRNRISAGLSSNITVLLRGGVYELPEPLTFHSKDSGTDKFSITYAAYPGEVPVLSGGKRITGWRKETGNVWTVELPDV